jgi:hypothetical protein
MPELEQLIAQWRRGLLETTGCSAEVLDELESHLRDEVRRLMQAGHLEEQAVALAASRLGSSRSLAAEFAKVAAPAPWLPARLVPLAAIILGSLFLGYGLPRWWEHGGAILAIHVCSVTLGYGALFFVGLLAVLYVARRPFRDLSAGQMKSLARAVFALTAASTLLTLTGVLLGSVWAKDHLGRYWGWDPKEIGGACVLAWDFAILLLFWLRRVPERIVIQLGILGNIVVGVAWFGSIPQLLAWLLVFILTQLALFGVGFVPAGRLRSREA